MPHTQVLRNSGERLQVTFTVDGVATDPDGNSATVTITKADGTVLQASTPTTRLDAGVYTYSLQPQADLNELTATWTGTFSGVTQSITTRVEVVGGYYCSLAELRAEPNLDSTTKFTTAKLIAARQWFETLAERYCNQAFVPRYRRLRLSGDGTTRLFLPDPYVTRILSVTDTATNTLFTADELADLVADPVSGAVTRVSLGVWPANSLWVEYEHGLTDVPDDIHDAAKIAVRDKLLNDQTGRPMLSIADGAGGTTRFAMPGPGRPTGIPDVDAALNGYRLPVVA